MKFSDEFRDKDLIRDIARRLQQLGGKPATIMEVCGTHTMAAARFGLKELLPPPVRLVSGPGCPVCVTAQEDLDGFLALGKEPGIVLASFGDMLRVPGTGTSLEKERARGAAVKVVYAPLDAVDLARQEKEKEVVFFGVGFETTMPATAVALQVAAADKVDNFSVFCVHKTMPGALKALLSAGEVKVSGLLCPGHVTTIIGAASYDFISRDFGIPCAVTGFEPLDLLLGVESILRQLSEGRAGVENVYTRAVPAQPNPRAQALLAEVFAPADAVWRGLGVIPGSGVKIREKYRDFDAQSRFAALLAQVPPPPPTACCCGDILRGVMAPKECPLFAQACSPSQPLGPCMVSSEGACAAAYRYERD
ncbi:MAG: hydrogenase formation protein HypD [Syntrophales bacterium]|nr:hydrogenase formation protein HypD [Syntrophales bacterium]MDD5640090.1 hydrogenase formation protein HypD [Syntrophales bacterium]